MADLIDLERLDDEIRARYPYPLAATFHRAFYDMPDFTLVHDYLLDLFEVTVKYLTAIVLAQYVSEGAPDPAIDRSLADLRRPSLGHWQGWLREIIRFYAPQKHPLLVPEIATFYDTRQKHPLLVPEIATFYDQKHTGAVFQAYTNLREMMAEQMD